MNIREATRQDFDQIRPVFHEIGEAGEIDAYVFPFHPARRRIATVPANMSSAPIKRIRMFSSEKTMPP